MYTQKLLRLQKKFQSLSLEYGWKNIDWYDYFNDPNNVLPDGIVEDKENIEIQTNKIREKQQKRDSNTKPISILESRKVNLNFKKIRDQLIKYYYNEFNKNVFGNKLPPASDEILGWKDKLYKTSGTTTVKLVDKKYTFVIHLSTKVVDNVERLRKTLAHEMCHAAAWVINHVCKPPHGKVFKFWAQRVNKVYPDIEVSVCHNYEIHYKYIYKCTRCGKEYGRHSKSIDTTKKCCGICRGKLELLNQKSRRVNPFAQFIKDNYSIEKKEHPSLSRGEIIKILSQKYQACKSSV